MKVVYTAAARRDLDEIAGWLAVHYPAIAPAVEQRIRVVIARIARWPESAPRSRKREGVRVIPLGHYPYKLFYRITTKRSKSCTSTTQRADRGTSRRHDRQKTRHTHFAIASDAHRRSDVVGWDKDGTERWRSAPSM